MPPHLYLKIVKTLNNNSTTGKCSYFDQESLLEELPSALKNEVMSCTHKKILHSFPFFRCKPPQFVMDVLPKFKHLLLSQDEALFRTGDLVEESNIYIYIYSIFSVGGTSGLCDTRWVYVQEFCAGQLFRRIRNFSNRSIVI